MPILPGSRLARPRWQGISVLVLSLSACSVFDGGEERTFKDEGKVCLFPEGAQGQNPFMRPTDSATYPADRALLVTVMAPICLSSSCSKDPKAQCTATLKGNVIEVTSTASVREEGNSCTADCGALQARCSTPPLPAGTYQVSHGAERLTLMVPSTIVPPCAGEAP
jgi:hypothetical protein